MIRYQRQKQKRKIEAGRKGGIRSQQVQREKRMSLCAGLPVYPARPRWSFGIRDNWSGEDGWFTFVSFRDALRRLNAVMRGLSVVVRRSPFRPAALQ